MGIKVVVEYDVNGEKFYAVYGHLNSTNVKVGQSVDQNTKVGDMGNTGTTDAHLHFEIRKSTNVNLDPNGNYVSLRSAPNRWWAENGKSLNTLWVDLGSIYGYSSKAPDDLIKVTIP